MNADTSPFLVADIGGTNARFALASGDSVKGFTLSHIRRLKNEDFEELRDAANAYLESCAGPRPERGCIAVAAPISGEKIRLTNSNWRFTTHDLGEELGLEKLIAVNDFAAQARGAVLTPASELVTLNTGQPMANAPIAILGPGTGLGLGLLIPTPQGIRTIATEGGHAGFAPRSDLEIAVGKFIAGEYGFASWERLLSGRGLVNIHRALCHIEGVPWEGYRPEDITAEALSEETSLSRRVVDLFCAALGAYAGDVAVITGARGGVYLGGGIVPKMLPLLRASKFETRFQSRSPMNSYTEAIPVHVLMSDEPALLGAAAIADQGEL